ncbi:unnamed protein product [Rhodiola kirilowii]
MASVREMMSQFHKLDKFEGTDFRRWRRKMHFLLTHLKVVYVLSTPCPKVGDNALVGAFRERNKWENDDYIARGHILNGMSDPLFDLYQNVESTKELWDTLEAKYMAEDASSVKILISNFNNYKMVDSRPVMEQFHEIHRVLGQYAQRNLKMDEAISVSSIIDKLPPAWKNFRRYLNYKKEEISNKKKHTSKEKVCWTCGKAGHFKRDYHVGKGKSKKAQDKPVGNKNQELKSQG